jgi:DNA-binding PadR family transcriptional regulator
MSAACASDDFNPYLRGVTHAAEALLGQARDALHGMSGAGRESQGQERQERAGRRGAPWARRSGPWERGFGWPGPGGPGGWGGPGGPTGGFGGGRGWWPGPPAPPRGPKAGRGDVRAAILALLREGPRNGYQIMSEVEERSGGAWRPSPGAVYPALQQLADEGLIEAEESGGRRTFSLTEAGRRHIEEDPDAARPAWEAMAQDEPGEMPGLFAQAARLGGSIVQLAHAGTPEQIRAAEQLLERTRRQMYQILASDDPDEDDEE